MAQVIPLSNAPRQTFRTILDGQNVRMTAWYQPLDEHWYLSILRLDRTPIISSVRLVPMGYPIRALIVADFTGDLIVEGAGDMGPEAWTTTHRLIYLAEGEIT
ncbi:MAG: hypothetical protein OXO51_15975 [Gemmatimonadota bacterium]|nr:hypothetical protein [Gemmatimonadota bacterium]